MDTRKEYMKTYTSYLLAGICSLALTVVVVNKNLDNANSSSPENNYPEQQDLSPIRSPYEGKEEEKSQKPEEGTKNNEQTEEIGKEKTKEQEGDKAEEKKEEQNTSGTTVSSGSDLAQEAKIFQDSITTLLSSKEIREQGRKQKEGKRTIKTSFDSRNYKEEKRATLMDINIKQDEKKNAQIESIKILDKEEQSKRINDKNFKDIDLIIEAIRDEDRFLTLCNEFIDKTTTLKTCEEEKIVLNHKNIDYTFEHTKMKLDNFIIGDSVIHQYISKNYADVSTNKENFIQTVKDILNAEQKEESPKEKTVKEFKKYLETEPDSISQKGEDFMIGFTLKDISFITPYKNNKIEGLFFSDVQINNRPLMVRSFKLELNDNSRSDINAFKNDPLSFIETFYPTIKTVYEQHK